MTGLALFAGILVATSTVHAQVATPDFRIIDVGQHNGQLLVEVEHFKPDGSFDYFENYMWQGREGVRFPRAQDSEGYLLLKNGNRAPFKVNPLTNQLDQYAPNSNSWLRESTPYLDTGSIIGVIQHIHDQRANWPKCGPDRIAADKCKRGQSRLIELPTSSSQSDKNGINLLLYQNLLTLLTEPKSTVRWFHSEAVCNPFI